jgi:NodT family efflux transporter outer membrane factor (OMF) lipoprotein
MNITDSISLASVSWQELFTDPLLQELITKGLEQNTDLNIARLRVEQAEALLLNAKLSYLPSVALSPEGSIGAFDGAKPDRAYNLSATVSWELDIFGKTTNVKRGAQAALEGSHAYRQAVQTQLISTIADSYYTLLMLDRQQAINEQTLVTWESSIRTFEALKAAGESNETAVLQAKANKLALESSIVATKQNIREIENQLSVLLGEVPQAIDRGDLSEQSFPDSLAVGVPVQLLRNRPDVMQAEFSLAQAFYATNAARATLYPSITLSGSAGWTNNGGGIVTNPGGLIWSVVGSLAQPIFNKGTNTANLRIAKAQQEEAQLMFQHTTVQRNFLIHDLN